MHGVKSLFNTDHADGRMLGVMEVVTGVRWEARSVPVLLSHVHKYMDLKEN